MSKLRQLAFEYSKKIKPTLLDSEIGSKLPDAYKKFYVEWVLTPAKPLHYIPHTGSIWYKHPVTGEIKRRENHPLPIRFPKELHYVFTGGECIIQGFKKKSRYCHRIPHFWMPVAFKSVIYSEILDKYFSVLMTKRAVELIHEHHGLDLYLLQTRACDLKSLVALKLKQKLLLALSNKDLPYNEEKNNEIFKKYEEYLLSPEEIEWYGLSFSEACRKFKEMEEAREEASIVPLKHIYRAQLIQQLKEGSQMPKEQNQILAQSSFISKIPGLNKLRKNTS